MIIAPPHMDRWNRMERLYRHLLGLGLYVSPIFEDADHTRIAYLHVAIDLPSEAVPPTAGCEIVA